MVCPLCVFPPFRHVSPGPDLFTRCVWLSDVDKTLRRVSDDADEAVDGEEQAAEAEEGDCIKRVILGHVNDRTW